MQPYRRDTVKQRLVEMYSFWGSSECSMHDGNPFPVKKAWNLTEPEEAVEGFVQRALALWVCG
jgi:hypothetical protein